MATFKSLLILVLCILSVQSLLIGEDKEAELVAQSFKKILQQIVAPINSTINVIIFNGTNYRLFGFMKYLMKFSELSFTFIIRYFDLSQILSVQDLQQASIIIYSEWVEQMILYNFMWSNYVNVLSVMYLSGATIANYMSIFKGISLSSISNLLVLEDDDDFLYLKSVTHITQASCNEQHFQIIDRFSKLTRNWDMQTFDFKTQLNFQQCLLKIKISADSPEIILPPNILDSNNFSAHSGYFTDITNELSKRLNARISLIDDGFYHLTLRGFSNDWQLITAPESRSFLEMDEVVVIHRKIFLIIPLGEYYTGMEKLFIPYDIIGWILITLTFAFGLVVIQVVNRLSRKSQRFLYGRGVTTPTMNLFAAFFGLSQRVLPGRNFSRFFLINFVLWSLIIRTAYQGVLFELLKSDGRKPQNFGFDDFMASDACFHVNMFTILSMLGKYRK